MYKNVSLIGVEDQGRKSFGLIDSDGRRIAAFDVFASSLIHNSINTRTTYCRGLARFFDFLIEATSHLVTESVDLKREDLVFVLSAYREYLVYGGRSGNQLACKVNSTMPSPMVSSASCELMHAPVRRFIDLSETVRRHLDELARHGILASNIDPNPLLPSIGVRKIERNQAAALRAGSMLAGVISGGPKLMREVVLPKVRSAAPYDERRAFPFDAAVPLINAMPTWRDKALYSFCAASGCRISEALQLLWADVRVADGIVKLVNPARRASDASYLALEPVERDKLVWKGRATQVTLLIEPFASLFFDALEQYVRHEYIPHGQHQFVFQHLRVGSEGRPYFLSAASTRSAIFKMAADACIGEKENRIGIGVHSLRHMYGTYLLNYFPHADGSYGLAIGLVKQLMGHTSIISTERYARHDVDLLQAELAFANAMVFGDKPVKSLNEMKRDVLMTRLAAVERAIEKEKDLNALTTTGAR